MRVASQFAFFGAVVSMGILGAGAPAVGAVAVALVVRRESTRRP
jgi:hypothetical protein